MRRKPWRHLLLRWKMVSENSQKVQPIPLDGLCYVLRNRQTKTQRSCADNEQETIGFRRMAGFYAISKPSGCVADIWFVTR